VINTVITLVMSDVMNRRCLFFLNSATHIDKKYTTINIRLTIIMRGKVVEREDNVHETAICLNSQVHNFTGGRKYLTHPQ
jgi:hypothetical protein